MFLRGFADFGFTSNARLVFAWACEQLGFDPMAQHPEAWVLEDRRISFAVDWDLPAADGEATMDFLRALLSKALWAEGTVSCDGVARLALEAAPGSSGVPTERVHDTEVSSLSASRRR